MSSQADHHLGGRYQFYWQKTDYPERWRQLPQIGERKNRIRHFGGLFAQGAEDGHRRAEYFTDEDGTISGSVFTHLYSVPAQCHSRQ